MKTSCNSPDDVEDVSVGEEPSVMPAGVATIEFKTVQICDIDSPLRYPCIGRMGLARQAALFGH